MPIAHQVRRGERDGGDVVAVEERNEDRPDDQLDVKAADASLVKQTRDVDYRGLSHRLPPHAEKKRARRVRARSCIAVRSVARMSGLASLDGKTAVSPCRRWPTRAASTGGLPQVLRPCRMRSPNPLALPERAIGPAARDKGADRGDRSGDEKGPMERTHDRLHVGPLQDVGAIH